MSRTPLDLNIIKRVPNAYATYAVRHDMTGRVFFGSTTALRDKLRWWFYAVRKPNYRSKLPIKVRLLLADLPDNVVPRFEYIILDRDKPKGYRPGAQLVDRPEWPLVQRLHQTNPELLLNTVGKPTRAMQQRAGTFMGVQPIANLGRALGASRGKPIDFRIGHSFKLDIRAIDPSGASPRRSFADYLYRCCISMMPRNKNPGRVAVQELYAEWLRHVPTSEREELAGMLPATLEEALAIPVPYTYRIEQAS